MSPLLYQLSYTATRLILLENLHLRRPTHLESIHYMPTHSSSCHDTHHQFIRPVLV